MKIASLRSCLLVAVELAMLTASVPSVAAAESSHARPNMVVVLIDDMGWGDLSCFGNEEVETPHIDRLAGEGLRFEQFYVNAPICSPSRAAISTGQYPARWRITSFLNDRSSNEQRGMAQWLDPKAPTLARVLQHNGYATGHFGKWHLGGQRDVGDAPSINEYGFENSLTNFEGLGRRVLPLLDAYDGKPAQKYSLGSDKLVRGPILWDQRDKVTATFTDAAIRFVDRAQSTNRPFYINLWPDDVHSPFFPPRARRGNGSKRALYLGVLKTLDEQLARLFERIRNDTTLRGNTLIIVCSDNGPEDGAGRPGPFRGNKTMLYEGGIRSPLVVWGPGLIADKKAGSVNASSFFSAMDLTPSLLEIAGIPQPSDVEFDGECMADTLLGRSSESRRGPLFFCRPPDRPTHWREGNLPDLAVRDGQWKFLCEYDGSNPQLYNLELDRGETNNMAANAPEVVDSLSRAALRWHRSMPSGDVQPAPRRE